MVTKFDPKDYDLVLVLTDSQWDYKSEWVSQNKNTVCINHFYQRRNSYIQNQINCSPFHSNSYEENFILPCYNIPDITLETKRKVSHLDFINIVIMGRFLPDTLKPLQHLKSNRIVFHIINVHGINECYQNQPNIKVYPKITTIDLYNVLVNSQYIYVSDLNPNHTKGYSSSAAIALSFNTLTQLIIPEKMNRHLRLRSAIIYQPDEDIHLQHLPNYELIHNEKKYFIDMRNRILDNLLE